MSLDKIPGHSELLKTKIRLKREEWRGVRSLRLKRKDGFMSKGFAIEEIRKDKQYRRLHKHQKYISKELKHLEKKLNRFFH